MNLPQGYILKTNMAENQALKTVCVIFISNNPKCDTWFQNNSEIFSQLEQNIAADWHLHKNIMFHNNLDYYTNLKST